MTSAVLRRSADMPMAAPAMLCHVNAVAGIADSPGASDNGGHACGEAIDLSGDAALVPVLTAVKDGRGHRTLSRRASGSGGQCDCRPDVLVDRARNN